MNPKSSIFDPTLIRPACIGALRKLDPRALWENPVMLITEIGAALCTGVVIRDLTLHAFSGFNLQITLWLWFTVLFANFAEALAEGRGRAQADSLRKARAHTEARRQTASGEERVAAPLLRQGDRVICETGDIIPADGDVVEGIASVDESAITGESAPVIREISIDRLIRRNVLATSGRGR